MTQDFLELAYFFSLESVAISCDRYTGVSFLHSWNMQSPIASSLQHLHLEKMPNQEIRVSTLATYPTSNIVSIISLQ